MNYSQLKREKQQFRKKLERTIQSHYSVLHKDVVRFYPPINIGKNVYLLRFDGVYGYFDPWGQLLLDEMSDEELLAALEAFEQRKYEK